MKPKTVKSFLKMCVAICEVNRDDLKGVDKLTREEYLVIGAIRASVQNDLAEDGEGLLDKYKLKVNI
jgi:hypothetical protein